MSVTGGEINALESIPMFLPKAQSLDSFVSRISDRRNRLDLGW